MRLRRGGAGRWRAGGRRLDSADWRASPRGPGEVFLAAAYQPCARAQRRWRRLLFAGSRNQPDGRATSLDAAREHLRAALKRDRRAADAAGAIAARKIGRQGERAGTLYQRARLEAAARGLERRAKIVLPAWIAMLEALETGEIARRIRRLVRNRARGRPRCRCRAGAAMDRSHHSTGRRSAGAAAWRADHLGHLARRTATATTIGKAPKCAPARSTCPEPPRRASFGSPFRLCRAGAHLHRQGCGAARRRCAGRRLSRIVPGRRAAGRLGLFTAVRSLARRGEPHRRPRSPRRDLTLYAQHVDRLDTGALVDLFRAEENACLLGTDALRDGVDVPGRSLRLVVFDKVPWPKPTILHKARRARFGKGYDDLLTRLRLKQAFGRLIRGPERQRLLRDSGMRAPRPGC